MTQQQNAQAQEVCDKINQLVEKQYLDKFKYKQQYQKYNDFIHACRQILEDATRAAQYEVMTSIDNPSQENEDKKKEALKYYIKQSTNENFQYKNVRAGTRPELQELIIRGNIYENYKLKIYQDIIELLNKHSDERIINALLLLIDEHMKQNIKEQTSYLIYEIYQQLYDKACIEVKYTQLYAKMIIQLTQKLLGKQYVQISKDFILYYHKDILKENNISFYQKNYDISFELHKVIQNIIFSKQLKEEIDKLQPCGSKYQINDSDDQQAKQQKMNIIDVHLKQCSLLALYLYIEDKQRKLMTEDIFTSFLLYLLNKQIEINKKLYPANEKRSDVEWINIPNKEISNVREGYYLKALITVLHQLKKIEKKLLVNEKMKTITDTLQNISPKVLSAYDNFALSETLDERTYQAEQQDEIGLSQAQQDELQKQQMQIQNDLKQQFKNEIDKVREEWLHQEYTILELFFMLADITDQSKDQVEQMFKNNQYDRIQNSIHQLIMLINDTKSQTIFLKDFQKVIQFINNKEIYQIILNACIEEQNEWHFKILCHYMYQEKINFQMIFNHKSVSIKVLKSLIEQQIRHFYKQAYEEYEEMAEPSDNDTLKKLINEGDLNELGKNRTLVNLMKDDRYGYFAQVDIIDSDYQELPNALEISARQSLSRWLKPVDEGKFIEKITQNKQNDTVSALKSFFDMCPIVLQIFSATKYCSDNNVKNLANVLEHAIEQYLNGETEKLKGLIAQKKHFISAQVLDIIYKTTKDKFEEKFTDILNLFGDAIDKKVCNELIEKQIKGSKTYGQNQHLIEWFNKNK